MAFLPREFAADGLVELPDGNHVTVNIAGGIKGGAEAADLAVVQGGLTTTMELTASSSCRVKRSEVATEPTTMAMKA